MIVRLSTKGQLVIPRRFREQLGLKAGTDERVMAAARFKAAHPRLNLRQY